MPEQKDELASAAHARDLAWLLHRGYTVNNLAVEAEKDYIDILLNQCVAEHNWTPLLTHESSHLALGYFLSAISQFQQLKRLHPPIVGQEADRPHLSLQEGRTKQDQENERLREENRNLKMQIELLKSRVADLRGTQTREVQRFDQLQSQNAKLTETNDRLVSLLSDRDKMTNAIVCQMAAVQNGHIRIYESYQGVVDYSEGDTVVVIYTVEGKPVEQTYERRQFIKGNHLPPVGTPLKVLVFVVDSEPQLPKDADEGSDARDEPSHRKPLTGPEEF